MALEWSALSLISDNLILYFFGTQLALAIGVLLFFLVLLVSSGIGFNYSVLMLLPLLASYAVGGVLGVNVWILNVGIIIAGIVYTSALIKVMT